MATLYEKNTVSNNKHLRNRVSAALASAAEDVRNEQQDFTALAATDVFTATAHGYSDTNKIELAGASLPTGVTSATTYYIRDGTANTFKLAATSGGAAIDITVDGHGQIAVEHHPARFTWGTTVLLIINGPLNEARRAAWLVVQNVTIVDGPGGSDGYVLFPSGGTGNNVTDSDVQFVVNGMINFLAVAEA